MKPICLLRGMAFALLSLGAAAAQAACQINGPAAAMAFGPYRPLTFASKTASARVDSASSISVTCNSILPIIGCLLPLKVSSYSVTISAGASGNALARAMPGSNGGSAMNYNLYTDAARSVVWGNGTSGTAPSGVIVGCGTVVHPLYGRIPAGQSTLVPGTFSEPLLITLTFNP